MFQTQKPPSYRVHKPSGQAVVTLSGRHFYLGPHGSKASRVEYDRLVGEWLAHGRRLPNAPTGPVDLTVAEVMASYWAHVKEYYRKPDGKPTGEQECIRSALKPLQRLYGDSAACEFGPVKLRTVRQSMIDAGLTRGSVNGHAGRIKRMFRWACEHELIEPSVYHGLMAVAGIQRGRTEARESTPVKPVADSIVDATSMHLTTTLRGMVELQRMTGMRPGEVCILRSCDIDTSGRVWVYTPATHKTEHHGRPRTIFIGPRAQETLKPFLRTDLQAFVFSPRQSEAKRLERRHAERVTDDRWGNKPGTNRKRRPRRPPGERYTTQSYARAIDYACDRAFPAPDDLDDAALKEWRRSHRWSPNQLRHSFATLVRREHGLEAAQVLLGHAAADITQVYAERDTAKAADVALKIG